MWNKHYILETILYKMLRVDGHDCWHELLNNDPTTNLHTQDALRLRLVDAEAICTEISWLNINEAGDILKEYLPEFPNIKRAVFYRSPVPYLNPQYSNSIDLVDFNIFQHSNHKIDVEFQDLDKLVEQQLEMPKLHVDQSLNHLESLYWIKEDEEFYFKVKKEETYYKWYQIIHLNKPEYSLDDYHSMIRSKLNATF